jgi:hypothetical protein
MDGTLLRFLPKIIQSLELGGWRPIVDSFTFLFQEEKVGPRETTF